MDADQPATLEHLLRLSTSALFLEHGLKEGRQNAHAELCEYLKSHALDPSHIALMICGDVLSYDWLSIERVLFASPALGQVLRKSVVWRPYVLSAPLAGLGAWLSAAGVETERNASGVIASVDLRGRGLEALPVVLGRLDGSTKVIER